MTSYLIKSILCSGILIVVYKLFLEREKMLVFNRFYLLLAIIFSIIVPLISIEIDPNVYQESIISETPAELGALQKTVISGTLNKTVQNSISTDWDIYIPYIFYLITTFLLVRNGRHIWVIFSLKSKCRTVPISGATLVLVPDAINTFTFLNNIFVPQKSFETNQIKQEIITHELAHASQQHRLDILFLELVQAMFWFNPFLLIYKRAIRLNHEFLADEAVICIFNDVKCYQLLLLDTILHSRQVVLSSSFNYSITKQRMAMMTKNKDLKLQFVKQSATALLAFTLTFVFSEKIYAQAGKQENAPQKKENNVVKKAAGSGLDDSEVHELYETISKHTTYRKNKQGQTFPDINVPPKAEDRIYALYAQMNPEQQQAVKDSGFFIFQMPIPVKKAPTPEIFENWKNPSIFGVWLNGKHVPNSELEKYKHTDIVEYDLSKLYGAARKGRSYKYQLELTTNDYFDKTFDSRVADRVVIAKQVRMKN